MHGVERVEDLFLGHFLSDEELDVVQQEDVHLAVAVAELFLGLGADRADQVVRERLVEYTPAPNNLSGQFNLMVRSELNNIEKIRQICGLDDQQVALKQAAIYSEWGLALFHSRDLEQARDCYRNVLKRKPSMGALMRWMATFLPRPILDLRRNRFLSRP